MTRTARDGAAATGPRAFDRELHVGPLRIVVEVPSRAEAPLVRFRFASPRGPLGPGLHLHVRSVERIEVHAGEVRLRRWGQPTVVLRAGEQATIPAGVPHSLWAVGGGRTRGRSEIAPAIPIDEAFLQLEAALARRPPRPWELARIARMHLGHTRLPWVPLRLQRLALTVLSGGSARPPGP